MKMFCATIFKNYHVRKTNQQRKSIPQFKMCYYIWVWQIFSLLHNTHTHTPCNLFYLSLSLFKRKKERIDFTTQTIVHIQGFFIPLSPLWFPKNFSSYPSTWFSIKWHTSHQLISVRISRFLATSFIQWCFLQILRHSSPVQMWQVTTIPILLHS